MQLKFAKKETLFFNEKVKKILRTPLGIAIFEREDKSIKKLKILLDEFKPKLLITVGDVVSQNVINGGLHPNLSIIDYRTKRIKRKTPIIRFFDIIYNIENPPSTISPKAWETIDKAINDSIESKKVLIVVEGEEDLLAIPSVMDSPENSFILYGQPSDAMVVIISTQHVKNALGKFIVEEIIANCHRKFNIK